MSFSENLKQIRKDNHLSQEELAELLDVSRQAVSKWEQGMGYPEVEKLLLSAKLNVSLDTLMSTGAGREPGEEKGGVGGSIVITSPNEHIIAPCYKVTVSERMKGGKGAPRYALFGVDRGGHPFWGVPTTFLGWYADEELASKEVDSIRRAITEGRSAYTLQYSAKTRQSLAGMKIVEV